VKKSKNTEWQFYDIDHYDLNDFCRDLKLLMHIKTVHEDQALVRSSSNNHVHLAVKSEKRCPFCQKYNHYMHEHFIEASGNQVLFTKKGRRKASKWFRVKDLKIWDVIE